MTAPRDLGDGFGRSRGGRARRAWRPAWLAGCALAWTLGPWAPVAAAPPPGTADLTIAAGPDGLKVTIQAPAATLVGFEGRARGQDQRETLALAVENLKTGDGLIRFNAQAFCHMDDARVDGNPQAAKGQAADLGASYRFVCDQPQALRSAAVALFIGFPALERVRVRYSIPGAQGEAMLAPRAPVLSFVPLGPTP